MTPAELNRAKQKRYRERHPDRVAKRIKEWKLKNKERVRQYNAAYRDAGKVALACRKYHAKNRKARNAASRMYGQVNRPQIRTRLRKDVHRLATWYVNSVTRNGKKKASLPMPSGMAEIRRLHLLIKRELWKRTFID